MKNIFKWIGIVLASLIAFIIVAGLVMFSIGNSRMNKTYDFPPSDLVLPTDEASLELGRHRAEVLCQGCHGADLGGNLEFFNDPALGTIQSANLTNGDGGIGSTYTTEDFVRAVRHGIDREGKPIFMPAVVSTAFMSDEELAAVIAYIKTAPPVDRTTNGANFTPLAKILYTAGMLPPMPVETVTHDIHVAAPEPGVSVEYGKYLMDTHDCRLCHGPDLNGGPFPDPTIIKISPNLTPGGELAFWSEEDFINTIRTGITPGGHELDSSLMPWQDYGKFHDDELKAIYMYLQSLPELPQYTE